MHECLWPGCKEVVKPNRWGCKKHFYRLPFELQKAILSSLYEGIDVDNEPGPKYEHAAKLAAEWIEQNKELDKENTPVVWNKIHSI